MVSQVHDRCADLESSGFDENKAAEDTWQALLSAGVFVEGDFIFASGIRATLKADAEQLYSHPEQLQTILELYASFPCVQDADVLLYVPNGMREFMKMLGTKLNKPVANTIRRPGSSSRYDFAFASDADKGLALSAKLAVVGEDIVTTLGSVAGLRALLGPKQNVHSLAILLRDVAKPEYREGLTDHCLLKREIPTDKDEFKSRLTGV